MPRLEIFLLGPPRIERDGRPVVVDTRKAVALMAYLAVTGESQSRDTLATLLWPEYDQASARAALRRTLSALNKALGGEWLSADRAALDLKRDAGLWLDVEQFRWRLAECTVHGHPTAEVCSACRGPLAVAAGLYHGDFMAGFSLRDSPDFDEWQFFQTESLRRELATALERLVRLHGTQREFEPAIACARRWLALDPLHEPAHRHLMELYAWAGQRAAALRQYRECVRVLDQELGVPPLDETTRLYEGIKEQRGQGAAGPATPPGLSSAPMPPPSPAPLRSLEYPLVGRATEWQTLLDAYKGASTGGYLVVLEGEAGIGKTRLAEAFLHHLRGRGTVTAAARCYEGEMHLAYGPFVEGLRAAVASRMQPTRAARSGWMAGVAPHWISEASRLLPELLGPRSDLAAGSGQAIPPPPPLDSPGAQSRFFEGMRQVLLAALGAAPSGVLLLDDLHWADEASLDLVTYLVRRLRADPVSPLLLVVTWRGEHLPPSHRLRLLLAEAQRAGTASLLVLSRLSLPAVAELAQVAVPRSSGLLAERLHRETEGLPFFVVEYLAALRNQQPGFPAAELDWSLPGGVRSLLRARLAGVGETGWQLLNAAAVIGRSFDLDTLQAASGRADEETVAGLEALMAQGIVHEVQAGDDGGGPTYDFTHEKMRDLVYDETSLARRRLLHGRVADALARRLRTHPPAPRTDAKRARRASGTHPHARLAGQVAEHYRLAGRDREAADQFKLAGEHARALYANADALSHFQSALALGHPEAAALHEAIGDLHVLSGNYAAALTSYETAAAQCPPDALPGLEHKLGNVRHRQGEWDLAESHFQAALTALGEQRLGAAQARIYADWSLTVYHRGQADRAVDLVRRALELAEAAGDARALAQVHNILGVLASNQGDRSQAYHHLGRSLALAESSGDPAASVAALNNLALAHGRAGEREEALMLIERALALCVAQGDRHREAALHSNLADLLHAAGQSEAARAHVKQSVTIYAEIGAHAGQLQPEIWKLTEW